MAEPEENQPNQANGACAPAEPLNRDAELRASLIGNQTEPAQGETALSSDRLANQFIKLITQGATREIIINALGISEDEYSKLAAREDLAQYVVDTETNRLTISKQFDDNWDYVENLALTSVAEELKLNPDPEFALRAAMVANKAVRRRREDAKLAAISAQNNKALPELANNLTILELPKVFINQLKLESEATAQQQLALQRNATLVPKFTDMADVSTAREALSAERSERDVEASKASVELSSLQGSLISKANPASSSSPDDVPEFLERFLKNEP